MSVLYAEKLLGGPLPWTRMRQAYGLIRLCDDLRGRDASRLVCQSALAFGVVDVSRIGRACSRLPPSHPSTPETAGGKVVSDRDAAVREVH